MAIGDSASLLFKIKSEYDNKGTSEAKKDVKGLGETAEKASSGGLSALNSELSLTGDVATTLAGPLAIAAAGIIAATSAAISFGTTLFNLAKQSADFGSAIHDARDQTGLSAESLSSLKLAADQSGSSLEEITGSVSKFSKLIGSAAEGSKQAKDSLIRLGLDPKQAINDLDGSLATVFKRIADAQNPIVATKLATEAFGKAGASIIPTIKSFDGDMAGLIKRAKELGVTLNDDAADASDEFGDSLDTLKASASGVANTFAREFMPQITNAMKEITRVIVENKDTFIKWGEEIAKVLTKLGELYDWFNSGKGQYVLEAIRSAAAYGTGNYTAGVYIAPPVIPEKQKSVADIRKSDDTNNKDNKILLSDPDAEKKNQDELKKRLAEFGEYNKSLLEQQRQRFETAQKLWQDQLDKGQISFEDYKKNLLDNIDEFAKASRALLEQGFNLDSQGKSGQALENARISYANALAKFNDEILRQKEEIEKKQLEVQKRATEERIKLSEDEANRAIEINRAKAQTDLAQKEEEHRLGITSEVQYQEAIAQIKLQDLEFEKKRLKEVLNNADLEAEKKAEITQKIALLDEKLTQQQLENSKKRAEAVKQEQSAQEGFIETLRRRQAAEGEEGEGSGTPSDSAGDSGVIFETILGGFGTSVEQMQEPVNVLNQLGQMLSETFNQVASAVGSAVKSFVLFGSAGGGFKKFAAEVLASIAQMAVVQAIFELAQGFAMLALAYFGYPGAGASATQHFIAAGVFGAIAGVAAVAGRVVAGDSFKQQTGQATGQGQTSGNGQGSGQGGRIYSPYGDDATVEERGANTPFGTLAQRNELKITIDDSKSNWFSQMFRLELSKNGDLRNDLRDLMAT